jgi:hypothetical protein
MCTHGADPAPPGIDPSVPRPLAGGPHPEGLLFPDPPGSSPSTAKAEPGIACYGNGQDGKRVQAVYAVPADRPDRFDEVIGSIRQWAADVDAVFQASAAKTGGVRRIRFVTDGACNLDVQHVRLTATGDDTFENTIAEFSAQGLNASDRKYLVWMDSTVLCGIATYYVDDRKTSENLNNGRSGVPGSIARTDSGCWGLGARGQSIEAHELMHSLGAVQPTAPHASPAGHCSDSADRMCYQDGTVLRLLNTCSTDHGAMFDCGSDDYFSTAPRAGNYLAARWNTADNAFLSSEPSEIGVPVPPSVPPPPPPPPPPQPPSSQGYWFVAADGGIFAFGDARFYGSTGSVQLNQPIVGMATTPTGRGYWLVARDGGIFAFGDAAFYGSTGDLRLSQPIVGMAATPTGRGYWFVAADGGVFAFGDATFHGSTGGARLSKPIVGMAATPSGRGYWFVAADGGIFPFGDAASYGSPTRPAEPIVGVTNPPSGSGYWIAGRDGTVFAFGTAQPYGSTGRLNQPVVGLDSTPTGAGYWLVARDGGIFSFGDARFYGSTGNIRLNQPIVGISATPGGGG